MGRNRGSSVVFAAAYVVLVLGLFLALGGAAYAQGSPTPTGDQYGTKVAGVKVSETSGVETAAASESLPSTGLSLLGVVAVGGVLVATGVALRRRENRKS